MANRRMLSRSVVESDGFIDLPLTTQALYMHLCMEADDDGVVEGSRRVQRGIGASPDDLKLLYAKGLLLDLDGVAVIADWRANNYIQRDRYTPSRLHEALGERFDVVDGRYVERAGQMALLAASTEPLDTFCIQDVSRMDTEPEAVEIDAAEDENSASTCMYTDCIQNVSKMDTQVRVGKVRLGKESTGGRETQAGPSEDERDDVAEATREFLAYLNSQTGSHFKASTKATRRLVGARLRDGYTLDDMKAVVDAKCADWLHDVRMREYLRPETLLRPSKFEGYLQQARASPPPGVAGAGRFAKFG